MLQTQALSVMLSGRNVFLTGPPGAGKTYVLNEFARRAAHKGKKVAITASTGIAASHLGGTTIHSWSGLGIVDYLSHDDLKRLGSSDRLIKRYNSTDTLVIDEVSMLHGHRLDMINELAKVVRGSDQAFGGLQVILVGDLFQLPPVSRGTNAVDFVHLSQAWQELDPAICYLTEQHRQSSNDKLLALLTAMRDGELHETHQELLTERMQQVIPRGTAVTRLFAHNIDVDAINQRHLDSLSSSTKRYHMLTKGSQAKVEQLTKSLLAPDVLELKVGAEVMFVANNFADGYVNGSRGTVIGFHKDTPVVELINGRKIYVEAHDWSLNEDGRVRAEASQLPLRLAWAITIHKSQGMSLDAAEIDLSRAFSPGMGYVALSRVRSLEGLYLQGINAMALAMHSEMFEFDRQLRTASNALAQNVVELVETEPESTDDPSTPTETIDDQLLAKLKNWRVSRARTDKIPAYIIAHDSSLAALAARQPVTEQQLLGTPGFGSKKVQAYGPELLEIIQAHRAAK